MLHVDSPDAPDAEFLRINVEATRALAEAWRPHRGATAIFTWHCYNNPAL